MTMVEMVESLALDNTTVMQWIPQKDKSWTVTPLGDVLLAALATEAYYLQGQLVLATELRTFNRGDELAELFEMVAFQITANDFVAYLQLDSFTNVYVKLNRPFVKKFTGSNVAIVEMLATVLGTVADFQDGYDLDDLASVSNDWGI